MSFVEGGKNPAEYVANLEGCNLEKYHAMPSWVKPLHDNPSLNFEEFSKANKQDEVIYRIFFGTEGDEKGEELKPFRCQFSNEKEFGEMASRCVSVKPMNPLLASGVVARMNNAEIL